MAQVIVTESSLQNIGTAIRSKLGTQDTYKPSEMAGAISLIHGNPVLETLTANANNTYTPSSGKDGFSQVVVNVPNTYASGDEGKVVSNGALVGQTSQSISANGQYDTTLKNQVNVSVPNSYSASDEGKVVDNGALVAQSSQTITENGTYDTTLKNQVTVNVSGGGSVLVPKTITQNGTYNPASDNADGYSQVVVNVSGGESSPKVIDNAIELVVARNDGEFDENEGVYISSGRTIEYDLGAANTDFTVYLVGKSVPTSGTARLLMSPYSSGTGNYCGFFRKNTHLWSSTYNNDDDLNIDANDVYIIAMSMDNTTKKIKFFANNSKVNEEDFLNSARKIVLGGDSGYYETLYCYYFAVVPSAQSESEILTNLAKINDNYINGEGGGGTADIESWDLTNSLNGTIRNLPLTAKNVVLGSEGAVFDSTSDALSIPISMIGISIELDIESMSLQSGTHRRFVMGEGTKGFIYRDNGKWAFYNGSWVESSITDGTYFDNCKVTVRIDASGYWHIYKDDVLVWEPSLVLKPTSLMIGSTDGQTINNAVISKIRIK